MNKISPIVVNTLRDALRRKQLWVLFITGLVVIAAAGAINVFGIAGQTTFALAVPLVVIPIAAMLMSTFTAARQVPTEIRERTIYPLLAKPLRRWQYLLGKYIGVVLISWFIIGVLFLIFQGLIWFKHIPANATLYQGLVLLLLQIAVYDALVLMLVQFLNMDATICLSILIYVFEHLIEEPVALARLQAAGWLDRLALEALTWIVPQFKLFNISGAVMFQRDPEPFTIVLPFALYASCLIASYLFIAGWRLEHRDL